MVLINFTIDSKPITPFNDYGHISKLEYLLFKYSGLYKRDVSETIRITSYFGSLHKETVLGLREILSLGYYTHTGNKITSEIVVNIIRVMKLAKNLEISLEHEYGNFEIPISFENLTYTDCVKILEAETNNIFITLELHANTINSNEKLNRLKEAISNTKINYIKEYFETPNAIDFLNMLSTYEYYDKFVEHVTNIAKNIRHGSSCIPIINDKIKMFSNVFIPNNLTNCCTNIITNCEPCIPIQELIKTLLNTTENVIKFFDIKYKILRALSTFIDEENLAATDEELFKILIDMGKIESINDYSHFATYHFDLLIAMIKITISNTRNFQYVKLVVSNFNKENKIYISREVMREYIRSNFAINLHNYNTIFDANAIIEQNPRNIISVYKLFYTYHKFDTINFIMDQDTRESFNQILISSGQNTKAASKVRKIE